MPFFHLHSSLLIKITDSKFANCNSLFSNHKKDILTSSNVSCTICESIRSMASKSDFFHYQRTGVMRRGGIWNSLHSLTSVKSQCIGKQCFKGQAHSLWFLAICCLKDHWIMLKALKNEIKKLSNDCITVVLPIWTWKFRTCEKDNGRKLHRLFQSLVFPLKMCLICISKIS